MADRHFRAIRADKGTELAKGVTHDDGSTEITIMGRLRGFTTLAEAEAALATVTTSQVQLVWAD